MQHDLAVAIAVKIMDNYYPRGDYSGKELQNLIEIISAAIKEENNRVGSFSFID